MCSRSVNGGMSLPLVVMLLQYLTYGCAAGQNVTLVSSYEAPTTELQHMTMDRRTGILYAAGTNVLVQLSSNFEQFSILATGPHEDSPECYGSYCTRRAQKQLTANHNKILLVNQEHEELITCGTLFQGSCLTLNLQNISANISTECEENCFSPVAANTKEASTVAFIAPGPRFTAGKQNPVLYVGVSYVQNGPFRYEFPTVSSRSLQSVRKFQLEEYKTSIKVLVEDVHRYPVNYIHGFSNQGFTYFLTTQKTSNSSSSPYQSKLVRVCQKDARYYSYTEVPLECKGQDGESYNLAQAAFVGKAGSQLAGWLNTSISDDVLFAVFAKGDQRNRSKPTSESALCVYSLKYIRQKFTENIQDCFSGVGKRGLEFLRPEKACHKTVLTNLFLNYSSQILTAVFSEQRITIDDDFCGMDINTPIGGSIPIAEAALIRLPVLLTAVTATTLEKSTLVFLGTSQGRLKKVAVDDKAVELEEVVIQEGATIMPDLLFDRGEKHLFAMTGRNVHKIRINDCDILTTCEQCSNDPYCGWCSTEGRCTQKGDCVNEHWVSANDGHCPVITAAVPDLIPRGFSTTIFITTSQLPVLESPIQCVFTTEDSVLTTMATQLNDHIACEVNPGQFWSTASLPQGYLNAKLSVRQYSSHYDLLTTAVAIFDCGSFSSCTTCSSSRFPCVWQVDQHRCSSTHRNGDNVIHGFYEKDEKNRRTGPSFCPRIKSFSTGSSEELIHLGVQQNLKVLMDNINVYNLSQSSFSCQLKTRNGYITKPASYSKDAVSCDIKVPSYAEDVPTMVTDLDILWDTDKQVEKPSGFLVVTYDCGLLADDCDTCSSLESKYACGWCESMQKCTTSGHCEAAAAADSAMKWFHGNETCPVEIIDFIPKREPLGGRVNVTITGRNFGAIEDISVAGIPCVYQPSLPSPLSVVCLLNAYRSTDEEVLGPVQIRNRRGTGESVALFQVMAPYVESVMPLKGPRSGGTLVTIFGRNLDSGINAEAWFHPDLHCSISFRNSTHIMCITGPSEQEVSGHFNLALDGAVQSFIQSTFTYFNDPIVHHIGCSATDTFLKQPRITLSGGNRLQVVGQGFNNVEDPLMLLRLNGTFYSANCLIKNDVQMECVTPLLQQESLINHTHILRIDVEFRAFGKPMQTDANPQHLLLFSDPYVEPPPAGMYELAREFLIVNGRGFDHICKDDLRITVGNTTCDMTKVSSNQLVCQLSSAKLNASAIEDDLAIEVVFGSKREIVGPLKFPPAQEGRSIQDTFFNYNSLPIYIPTAGILVPGLLFIAVFFHKKMKSSKARVGNMQHSLQTQKDLEKGAPRENGHERHFARTVHDQYNELLPILEYQEGEFSPISSAKINLAFPRDKLTALDQSDKLGSGFYGCVYRAVATGLFPNNAAEKTVVAVKTVLDAGDTSTLKALKNELKILAELDPHPHVLKLLGACTDNLRIEKLLLLLEYCPLGSMKSFLGKNKDSFVRMRDKQPLVIADSKDNSGYEIPILLRRSYALNCCSPHGKLFCPRDLLQWARQIASGMEHLTLHKVLHGDLAARNILLSSERQVKIADFGLARDMYCSGLYEKRGDDVMPFKWLAPESLKSRQFSSQSDVWTFGVVLWEIFSLGNEPYPGFGPGEEFVTKLEKGYRLLKPEYASDNIHNLMRQCWSLDPKDRPTFTQLKEILAVTVEVQRDWNLRQN